MKKFSVLLLGLVLICGLSLLSACAKQETAEPDVEEAAAAVETVAEEAGEMMEEAVEGGEEMMEEAAEGAEETMEEAAETMEEMGGEGDKGSGSG